MGSKEKNTLHCTAQVSCLKFASAVIFPSYSNLSSGHFMFFFILKLCVYLCKFNLISIKYLNDIKENACKQLISGGVGFSNSCTGPWPDVTNEVEL